MIENKEIREIGKFQKTHALKGELNAISDVEIDFYEMDFPIIVEMDNIFVPFYIESVRPKGNTSILIKLRDIDSEEKARQFVNKTIYAGREDLKEYSEEIGESYFDEDSLEGYKVIDASTGEEVGVISDVDDSTENILLIVNTGEDEVYIPGSDELIKEIDDARKRIIMVVPEGITDINRIHQDNDEI